MAVAASLHNEADLIAAARRHDKAAIRTIVRGHNQRLFRVARSILRDDWEAEEAVQEAYIRAFAGLDGFEGRSSLGTWLTRIVINEALARLRRRKPMASLDEMTATGADIVRLPLVSPQPDPERTMAQREIHALLEKAIDELPDDFRIVLVARVIEEMSVEETAELFGLRPETVKTRLHRARTMLRKDLETQFGPMLTGTYPFAGRRCEMMADRVIARLGIA
jgi:RNA polymerase sigma-70 factor (ECF subfamily)